MRTHSTLGGAEIGVAREPGEQALVLHFWASWCPECREDLPALEHAARACAAARVRVLAVNVGETAEQARDFAEELVWTADGVRSSEGQSSAARWREQLAALGCR